MESKEIIARSSLFIADSSIRILVSKNSALILEAVPFPPVEGRLGVLPGWVPFCLQN